jgi:4-alpha-glucanotransferase
LLLHVTSLPSPYGIGDVGAAALAWIDVTLERIGDLMLYDLPAALPGRRQITFSAEVTR